MKSSYGIFKISLGKNDPKNRNGKILRTFGPYIFWPKLLKSVQVWYIYYKSFVFLICFARISERYSSITELYLSEIWAKHSYNGGGVVYLLKSELSISSLQYVESSALCTALQASGLSYNLHRNFLEGALTYIRFNNDLLYGTQGTNTYVTWWIK